MQSGTQLERGSAVELYQSETLPSLIAALMFRLMVADDAGQVPAAETFQGTSFVVPLLGSK